MRTVQRLFLALAAMLVSLAASAQESPRARTYRAQAGDATLLVRAGDEQIDLLHLGTNQSMSIAAFPTPGGMSGVASSGEIVSLGNMLGKPHLLVGATLLPLTPITAAEYDEVKARGQRSAAAAQAAPGAGAAGSLGGVALLYAKSNNGYGQMKRFDFCSDGSFHYRFEEIQTSQSGSGAGERNDAGTWSLNGNQLTVNFRGQGTRTYAFVVRSQSSVSLDGTVYAAERSGRCR
jgi:hypothetical protein